MTTDPHLDAIGDDLLDAARSLQDHTIELRRAIHAEPEIGLQLPETQRKIVDALTGLDLEITLGESTTSVVADLDTGRPGPTVLLSHEQAGAPPHVDWLLARDTDGTLPLASFRLPSRMDTAPVGTRLAIETAPDHRPIYLAYEGALSEAGGASQALGVDRGRVARLRRGVIVHAERAEAGVTYVVRWEPHGELAPSEQRLRVFHGHLEVLP